MKRFAAITMMIVGVVAALMAAKVFITMAVGASMTAEMVEGSKILGWGLLIVAGIALLFSLMLRVTSKCEKCGKYWALEKVDEDIIGRSNSYCKEVNSNT